MNFILENWGLLFGLLISASVFAKAVVFDAPKVKSFGLYIFLVVIIVSGGMVQSVLSSLAKDKEKTLMKNIGDTVQKNLIVTESVHEILLNKVADFQISSLGTVIEVDGRLQEIRYLEKKGVMQWPQFFEWISRPSKSRKCLSIFVNKNIRYHDAVLLMYLMAEHLGKWQNDVWGLLTLMKNLNPRSWPPFVQRYYSNEPRLSCVLILDQGNLIGSISPREMVNRIISSNADGHPPLSNWLNATLMPSNFAMKFRSFSSAMSGSVDARNLVAFLIKNQKPDTMVYDQGKYYHVELARIVKLADQGG